MISKLLSFVPSVITSVIGMIFIAIAASCVVELSSRISAKSFVLQKLDRIEKLSTSFERNDAGSQAAEQQVFKAYLYQEEIEILRVILDDLEHLSVTGAEDSRQTVHAIRQRLSERTQLRSAELASLSKLQQVDSLEDDLASLRERGLEIAKLTQELELRIEREITTGSESGTRPGEGVFARELAIQIEDSKRAQFENEANIAALNDRIQNDRQEIADARLNATAWSPSVFVRYNYLLYLPTDFVTAIAVILCGGIGSIFAASRSRRPNYSKAIFNGLLAGFVAFLAIKGGRFLLLIEVSPDSTTFLNPYAAAFSGILAGLFTEKAYRVLSEVTDQIGEKVIGNGQDAK